MGQDGLGFNQAEAPDVVSLTDRPRGLVTGDEAVLRAKTFTTGAAIVIFHRAGAPLIRAISGGGERVVKGKCLTSFSQKLSHKDFPLLF